MSASDILTYLDAYRDFETAHRRYVTTHAALRSVEAITAASVARCEALARLREAWEGVPGDERAGLCPPALLW